MAEPVGATLGAVSLATALSGIFVSVVECFEYVELGRRFAPDFNKSQARLAALRLEITRWGVSAGVLPDPRTGNHRTVNVDAESATVGLGLFTRIQDDILEVEHKSKKYRDQTRPSASAADLTILGPSDMDTPTMALNSRANAIITKRVHGVSWGRKAKWALYEKKLFDRLLEDITENLGTLKGLFPQLVEPQQELCRIEVEEVQQVPSDESNAVMELLHDASQANKDTLLEQAVQEVISKLGGKRWQRTEVSDDVELHQGERISQAHGGQARLGRIGHDYGVTIGSGRAKIHQGDTYE
jgi:hypothetical protein